MVCRSTLARMRKPGVQKPHCTAPRLTNAMPSVRLSVSGTDAAATWAVADASVLSISADGLITPAKVGTTTVTATVGGAVLTITVRIK